MTTTAALVAEAKKPEIAAGIKQIYAVQALVRAKKDVPLEYAGAVAVLVTKGHLRHVDGVLTFTPEGDRFAKASKRYSKRLGLS